MKTPEIDKLISTLEYQVNVELLKTPKKVNLLEELKKLKQVNNVVLDAVIIRCDFEGDTECKNQNIKYTTGHCLNCGGLAIDL
tara:strand:+ start:43 stop:291 length:249 start_codon:yes stop_codon:yes gene_type:complete